MHADDRASSDSRFAQELGFKQSEAESAGQEAAAARADKMGMFDKTMAYNTSHDAEITARENKRDELLAAERAATNEVDKGRLELARTQNDQALELAKQARADRLTEQDNDPMRVAQKFAARQLLDELGGQGGGAETPSQPGGQDQEPQGGSFSPQGAAFRPSRAQQAGAALTRGVPADPFNISQVDSMQTQPGWPSPYSVSPQGGGGDKLSKVMDFMAGMRGLPTSEDKQYARTRQAEADRRAAEEYGFRERAAQRAESGELSPGEQKQQLHKAGLALRKLILDEGADPKEAISRVAAESGLNEDDVGSQLPSYGTEFRGKAEDALRTAGFDSIDAAHRAFQDAAYGKYGGSLLNIASRFVGGKPSAEDDPDYWRKFDDWLRKKGIAGGGFRKAIVSIAGQ
jgi:hypothetical protein